MIKAFKYKNGEIVVSWNESLRIINTNGGKNMFE